MNYIINDNIQIDWFADGDAVVYDTKKEKIHILTCSAATALKIITDNNSDICSKYINSISSCYEEISVEELKKDFENIIKAFIEKNIIFEDTTG